MTSASSSQSLSSQAASALIANAVAGTALATLGTLLVKDTTESAVYDVAAFGTEWADTDNNQCDTWNDILARDLKSTTVDAACAILTGQLLDPYTATTIVYASTAAPSLIAVDAVVTTQAAWAAGAQSWDAAQRQVFANDPFNLLAVGSMTSGLRSSGTSDWLPPDSTFHCAYVARQIAVAAKYGLTINAAERAGATEVLSACPKQMLPEDTAAIKAAADKQAADVAAVAAQAAADQQAAAAAAAAQTAADQQAADQAAAEQAAAEQAAAQAAAEQAAAAAAQAAAESAAAEAAAVPPPAAAPATSYANCDAVRAAGAAPIHRGDPGYSSKLDRDGDGIGCEN